MTLNRNPENFFAQIEQAAFEPSAVVPGIGFSPDKMLLGRAFAYSDTHRHRIGPNYLQPGQPSQGRGEHLHPGRRDGLRAPRGRPGLRTELVRSRVRRRGRRGRHSWEADGAMVRQAYTLRPDDDDFSQAGTLVREVWTDEIRAAFVKTVAGHLLGGVEGDVLGRAFQYWKSVDADTGKQIEELVRNGATSASPAPSPTTRSRTPATRSSSRTPTPTAEPGGWGASEASQRHRWLRRLAATVNHRGRRPASLTGFRDRRQRPSSTSGG